MPRRNEDLPTTKTAYWVKQPNGKGYTVYSKVQLDNLIAKGEITAEHRVQFRTIT
jgi:hypothetical protein